MGESSEDTVGEIFLNAENSCAVVETRQSKLPKITPSNEFANGISEAVTSGHAMAETVSPTTSEN